MAQTTVVISRQWHTPAITVAVSNDGIRIDMSLADYLSALCQEIGSPVGIFTKAQLTAKVQGASDAVLLAMKYATTEAV